MKKRLIGASSFYLIVSRGSGVELVIDQDRGGVVVRAVGTHPHPLALLGHQVAPGVLHILPTLGLEGVGATDQVSSLVVFKLLQDFDIVLTGHL